ncbi:MAG: extracellular solute-binding protein [Chloroflexi bacterium]|nr:extracellular solute-binding protein [Chloroflexota bacterium]
MFHEREGVITMSQPLTRRTFLAHSAATTLGLASTALLAACGGAAAATATTVTQTVTKATVSVSTATVAKTSVHTATVTSVQATTVTATVAAPGTPIQTVNVWFDYGGGGMYAFEDITNAFNQHFPNIKAVATKVNDYGTKRLNAIASNTLQGGWAWLMYGWELPGYVEKKLLRPIDDYIARDKVNMKDFWPAVLADTSWNGKYYAMTNHPAVSVFWVNQDLLKAAGMNPTVLPGTWNDILSAAQKLTTKSGGQLNVVGLDPTSVAYSSWAPAWMAANGVELLSADGRKATFNTAAAQAALNYVLRFVEQVYGSKAALDQWYKVNNFHYAPIALGKVAMQLNGNWLAWDISQQKPPIPFTVGALSGGPDNPGKQYLPELGVFNSIPAPATAPDPSWEYINFFASKEGQIVMQRQSQDVPGNIAAAEDPAEVKSHFGRAEVLKLFKESSGFVYVRSPVYAKFNDIFGKLSDDVIKKKADVTSALLTAEQTAQGALDAYWSKT